MNKAQKIAAWFFIVSIIAIAALLAFYFIKTSNSGLPNGIVFYYGATCPHCRIVEEFIENNSIDAKINFTSKEVFGNPINQAEFKKVIEKCKIPSKDAGVPLLYDGDEGKCYESSAGVIAFFEAELN